MGIQASIYNEIVSITSPTLEALVQNILNTLRDAEDTIDALSFGDPVGDLQDAFADASGKADLEGGVVSGIIMTLGSAWQIQFWGGSGYTVIKGGTIVGGVSSQPMKATGTAGDITVMKTPTDATIAETGVSGLTPTESAQLSGISTRTVDMMKFIKNKKLLVKTGSVWELIIYDDDDSTPILQKDLKDADGNNITDLEAGILAQELQTSV